MNSIDTTFPLGASEQLSSNQQPEPSGEQFSLNRTGDCPLIFNGARIGFGTTKTHQSDAWTEITIYKTAGGAYIVAVDQCTAMAGEGSCHAMTFAHVHELVEALRDTDGKLDRASQGACEAAARNDEEFMQGWMVKVP